MPCNGKDEVAQAKERERGREGGREREERREGWSERWWERSQGRGMRLEAEAAEALLLLLPTHDRPQIGKDHDAHTCNETRSFTHSLNQSPRRVSE